MAGEGRTAPVDLGFLDELEREPHRFDFYQAVRRLECVFREKPRIGHSLRPSDDPVRLTQEPSLAFAPSTLASFSRRGEGAPPRLSVHFFGLLGPNGPLPLHLTEFARDRLRNASDPTLVRFLDVFHHRMLTLFYRAWASAEPAAAFDRPESDRFALYVGSLLGLGTPSLRDRDAMPDLTRLHYAGLLANQTRHAEGLGALLEGFFEVPVFVEEFVGEWLELPEQSRLHLGASRETGSLGQTTVLGGRIWQCQHKCRVVLGPLGLEDYRRLLPGSPSLERLASVVRSYVGDGLSWDLQVILRGDEVPACRLDGEGRLGLTTWLGGGLAGRDADQLVLAPQG